MEVLLDEVELIFLIFEVLAIAPSSIGRQLHDAKTSLEMVDLFAWTGFIILLSVALERGMVALLARIFPGKEGS